MIDLERLGQPMSGDGCRIEPFAERHREPLQAACAEDLEIWNIYSNDFGPGGFDKSINAYLSKPNGKTFVLFQDPELVGMSSFINIDQERSTLEIGATYYRPKFRGTGINTIIKHLMLSRAFQCGAQRIEFRVDTRNVRSQAAMAKLGARKDRLLRKDRMTWTGYQRDTIIYSITKDDWQRIAPTSCGN